MNKDQVKGRIKEAAGEVQEHTGRLVGSKEQEAKGHAREMEGKVQKNVGDAREDVKDAFKKP
ncbi:MAG: CsbD family protein [Polaromonas sp.]|nr:CsbD family protein [Polaromonas sp.]